MKLRKLFGLVLAGLGLAGSTVALTACNDKEPKEEVDPNEAIVTTAIDALTVQAEATANFTLTTQGAGGVAISWASNKTDVIAIEGGNATVTRPSLGSEDATVTLTATAVLGEAQKTKTFTVKVKAVELDDHSKTVKEIVALADDTETDVHGVVTGFVYNGSAGAETKAGFYLTDATGTIYVFGANTAANLSVNDEVYFSAKKTTYKDCVQLSYPTDVQVLGKDKTPDWTAVIKDKSAVDIYNSKENIVGNVYEFVALVYKNNYGAYSVEDPNYSKSGAALGDYFAASSSNDLTQYAALLRGKENTVIKVKYVVNSKNGSGKWRGTTLAVSEVTAQDVADYLKLEGKNIITLDENYETNRSIDLPANLESLKLNGVSIAWSLKEGSTGAAIADSKLNITATDDLQKFTLIATATVSGVATPVVIEMNEVSVKKSSIVAGENQTVTLAYTGNATTNMTGENQADLLGLNSEIFSVVSNAGNKMGGQAPNLTPLHVGLNKAGEIRLYGNTDGEGNSLIISVNDVPGYNVVINSITITFGNTVGTFTVNGAAGAKETTVYQVNGETVTIKNTTEGATTQVYIKSIVINYTVTAA